MHSTLQILLCRHINTVLNGKIQNLPTDFDGVFVLEESYYWRTLTPEQKKATLTMMEAFNHDKS